jgi:hypothetical protein
MYCKEKIQSMAENIEEKYFRKRGQEFSSEKADHLT